MTNAFSALNVALQRLPAGAEGELVQGIGLDQRLQGLELQVFCAYRNMQLLRAQLQGHATDVPDERHVGRVLVRARGVEERKVAAVGPGRHAKAIGGKIGVGAHSELRAPRIRQHVGQHVVAAAEIHHHDNRRLFFLGRRNNRPVRRNALRLAHFAAHKKQNR